MVKQKWPPIDGGTMVRTTQPDPSLRGRLAPGEHERRIWNARGKVTGHSDSHGLCYEVLHDNGAVAFYGPEELELLTMDALAPVPA